MTDTMAMKETFGELKAIETRIAIHVSEARRNFLEVGLCLNEAKDRGLVAHGEWEDWVRRNTGLSERNAQRLMKAAREVPAGSTLARLDMGKVMEILTLPEPEREDMAKRAEAESLTVKQLREEIKRERDEKAQLKKTNQVLNRGYNDRGEKLRSKDKELEAAQKQIESTRRMYEKRGEELSATKLQLDEACRVLNRRNDGISPKAQEKIDELTEQLREAEAYAEEQARLRQDAQQQMLAQQIGQGGTDTRGFEFDDLESAVRVFLGEVGVMVYMGAELARLDDHDRGQIRRQVEMIEDWAYRVREKLDKQVIVVEGGARG